MIRRKDLKVSTPTKDELRWICPIPTPEIVDQMLEMYYASAEFKKEQELIKLFKDYYSNTTPLEVDIKTDEVINFSGYDVSKQVLTNRILESKTFASQLQHGDPTAVDYLIGTTQSCAKYAPFAFSYCYFQKPKKYLPGVWCIWALKIYQRLDKFIDCSVPQYVQCYSDFIKLITKFQRFYKLKQYSAKELVYFLHMINADLELDRAQRVEEYHRAEEKRSQERYERAIRRDRTSQNDLILQILQGKQPLDEDSDE